MEIKNLLELTIERGASDLHLLVGSAPVLRVNGVLSPVTSEPPLTPDELERLLKSVLNAEQVERLTVNKEIDFSLPFSERGRFRVNAYTQKATLAASFRLIPLKIPSIDSLGLPKICHKFSQLRQGFVLITGPTGHGKSTTIAAILEEINQTRPVHIVTIEDPIEFVFRAEKAIISQRELRSDTHSWEIALRSVLREDPDIVLVGEMRDFETIAAALTVAETGHLVLATLHTNSAAQSVDRIVDVFPEEQQQQVRLQLSLTLEAVFSMRLVPAIPAGRVPAYEVMLGTSAIKTAIREAKTHQIDNIIQTSAEIGMSTLEASLVDLIKQGKITLETAQYYTSRPEELTRIIRKTS